nr:MAG TPA: hypothetical protein [Caudoviricetes sp.]
MIWLKLSSILFTPILEVYFSLFNTISVFIKISNF